MGDPRKMMSKKMKETIQPGNKLFKRDMGDANRKGYLQLLNKVQESNFAVQQIKNGCSTLFDKDFMRINYTNPHLTNEELKR